MEKISEFLKQFGIVVAIGMVGCGILIYGLWGVIRPEEAVVEIINGENREQENIEYRGGQVTVDVAGAVEWPGVYKLPSGSRIGDALVMAGGLAGNADREWVAKTINLAEVVKDGGKIYVPAKQEQGRTENKNIEYGEAQGRVNINTASVGELDRLEGIGEVRARAIIDNRPYGSTLELVSKAKIPESVYDDIKDQVSVY